MYWLDYYNDKHDCNKYCPCCGKLKRPWSTYLPFIPYTTSGYASSDTFTGKPIDVTVTYTDTSDQRFEIPTVEIKYA